MKHLIASLQIVAAAAMILSASMAGTATSSGLSDAQRQFAAAFASAANSKDAAAMRKLVMPQSLACYNKETEPYLDRWIQTRLRSAIPNDYTVTFAPYKGGPISGKFITVPAQPTETMEIEFRHRQQITLINSVREDSGYYYLVAPCLTAQGAKHFTTDQAKRADTLKKAHDAYAKLPDQARAKLANLVSEGRTREALMLCKRELKLDSDTALEVLDLVAGRGFDAQSGRPAR